MRSAGKCSRATHLSGVSFARSSVERNVAGVLAVGSSAHASVAVRISASPEAGSRRVAERIVPTSAVSPTRQSRQGFARSARRRSSHVTTVTTAQGRAAAWHVAHESRESAEPVERIFRRSPLGSRKVGAITAPRPVRFPAHWNEPARSADSNSQRLEAKWPGVGEGSALTSADELDSVARA